MIGSPQSDTRPHGMSPDGDRVLRASLTNGSKDMQNIVNHSANTRRARGIAIASIVQGDDVIAETRHHPIVIRPVVRRSKQFRSNPPLSSTPRVLPRSILSV